MSEQDSGPDPDPHIELDELIHHTDLPHTTISRALDRFVKVVGDAISWLWVLLIGVIVVNVVLRYAFGQGYISLEELQWHICAVGWLIGLSYCVQNDSHIRIDILHDRFGPKSKAWIDFVGIILFLIPYTYIVLRYSPTTIGYSFETNEISDAAGGLPYRWAIKGVMWIAFAVLLVAAIARLIRAARVVFGDNARAADILGCVIYVGIFVALLFADVWIVAPVALVLMPLLILGLWLVRSPPGGPSAMNSSAG